MHSVSPDDVLGIEQAVLADHTCCICLQIPITPFLTNNGIAPSASGAAAAAAAAAAMVDISSSACEHMACQTCFIGWIVDKGKQTCPECRRTLRADQIRPDIRAHRRIAGWNVRCAGAPAGCAWTGTVAQLSAHMHTCIHCEKPVEVVTPVPLAPPPVAVAKAAAEQSSPSPCPVRYRPGTVALREIRRSQHKGDDQDERDDEEDEIDAFLEGNEEEEEEEEEFLVNDSDMNADDAAAAVAASRSFAGDHLIPRSAFRRLVQEHLADLMVEQPRMERGAMNLLQSATEQMVVDMFRASHHEAQLAQPHAAEPENIMVTPKHMQMARRSAGHRL